MLSDQLTCRVDVINRGYSGWTTNFFRQVMGSILDKRLFKGSEAVTLFLGANDACLRDKAPTLHVPLDEYKVQRFLNIGPYSCIFMSYFFLRTI